jgi:3-deoxy-D-manno-octulosonic-acid transferase
MAGLALYRGLTSIATPVVDILLKRRLARGKEDPDRLPERRGVASRARPPGPLVWLHAASVGEAQSALALIGRILDARPEFSILVTTGTVTSARLLAERLPPRSLHQFVPVDCPSWVGRFFDHWRPDLALWMESELWPNLLGEAAARSIPAILVNGRMSARSFGNWRRFSGSARSLLGKFVLCLAQSEEQADRLRRLQAPAVDCVGNLKYSAAPLPADDSALQQHRTALDGRPLWLAASTHPGEEDAAATVHRRLKDRHPALLTIIVPRHPARATEIADTLRADGLTVMRRSENPILTGGAEIYLADTMGELGLFYRLAPIAFVGGSLSPHGGHNPLEPAQLGCAVLYGPDMTNFQTVADALEQQGGARRCADTEALAHAVNMLLNDETTRHAQIAAAKEVADANRSVVDRVYAVLTPYLDRI